MSSKKEFTEDFDEIVFEKRFKEYGAYKLRHIYKKHMTLALAISITLLLIGVGAPLIAGYLNKTRTVNVDKDVVVDLGSAPKKEDAPPPPPPPPRTSSSEQTAQDTVAARATAVATATARSVVAQPQQHSFILRLGMAILVLWSAAAVACSVKSIDIVWDLLGSSLSIFLSYLIPCGSFIIIMEQSSQADEDEEDGNSHWKRKGALLFAKIMLAVYIPLMLISTGNAVVHTFF